MSKRDDLTGRRFGRLTVLSFAGKPEGGRELLWNCKCDCEKEVIVFAGNLRSEHTRSCGCLDSEVTATRNLKHGYAAGYARGTKPRMSEYTIWKQMRARCNSVNSPAYPNYGGRGISVCSQWDLSKGGCFENFLRDVGMRPSKNHSLDRIKNDGNYEPENVRWATAKEQANNRRTKRIENFSTESLITELRTRNITPIPTIW